MSVPSAPSAQTTNYAKGVAAEQKAADYLRARGCDILQSRYKTKFGEVDIIAKHDDVVCFVEVKVRGTHADALESITARARKRIQNAALFFISENPELNDHAMRFDVITISGDGSISHLDNAWQACS